MSVRRNASFPLAALTDRGTWLAFVNKDDFKVLAEGDDKLFNQYGVILVTRRSPRM
jgi:tungstate transport system substrate-binding protein